MKSCGVLQLVTTIFEELIVSIYRVHLTAMSFIFRISGNLRFRCKYFKINQVHFPLQYHASRQSVSARSLTSADPCSISVQCTRCFWRTTCIILLIFHIHLRINTTFIRRTTGRCVGASGYRGTWGWKVLSHYYLFFRVLLHDHMQELNTKTNRLTSVTEWLRRGLSNGCSVRSDSSATGTQWPVSYGTRHSQCTCCHDKTAASGDWQCSRLAAYKHENCGCLEWCPVPLGCDPFE